MTVIWTQQNTGKHIPPTSSPPPGLWAGQQEENVKRMLFVLSNTCIKKPQASMALWNVIAVCALLVSVSPYCAQANTADSIVPTFCGKDADYDWVFMSLGRHVPSTCFPLIRILWESTFTPIESSGFQDLKDLDLKKVWVTRAKK